MTAEVVSFIGSESNTLVASQYGKDNERPPVLLMHGGGQTRHSWHSAAKKLAKIDHTAFTVDARGHGDSEWLDNQHYTFQHYADDLWKLANDLQSKRGQAPILIGASMGGISAMIAQAGNPALFSAIVFVDITPRMETSGVDKILGFMAQNMRDGFESVEAAAEVVSAYLPNRPRPKTLDGLRKNLRQRDDGRFYWHWDPAFIDGPHNIASGRETRADELKEMVRKIEVPTLLVRGSKSELVSDNSVAEFKELVPHARYADVSDAGHMVAGDKNDVFAAAVIDFIKTELSH